MNSSTNNPLLISLASSLRQSPSVYNFDSHDAVSSNRNPSRRGMVDRRSARPVLSPKTAVNISTFNVRSLNSPNDWKKHQAKDQLIPDIVMFEPRPTASKLSYLKTLCHLTGTTKEELPGLMSDRDNWKVVVARSKMLVFFRLMLEQIICRPGRISPSESVDFVQCVR